MTESDLMLRDQVLQGEYVKGLDLYQSIANPTPDDQRWAGFCLLMQQDPFATKNLLLAARGNGCEAAVIELAVLRRILGELDTAHATLLEFNPEGADALDQALAARELGVIFMQKVNSFKLPKHSRTPSNL